MLQHRRRALAQRHQRHGRTIFDRPRGLSRARRLLRSHRVVAFACDARTAATSRSQKSFVVVPVALIVAAVVAGAFGFLVGLPSLRLRGDYLAIVTLGFAEIVRLVIATASTGSQSHGFSAWIAHLGGQTGYAGPDESGVPLYAGPFWIIGVTTIMFVIAWRLKFSGWWPRIACAS